MDLSGIIKYVLKINSQPTFNFDSHISCIALSPQLINSSKPIVVGAFKIHSRLTLEYIVRELPFMRIIPTLHTVKYSTVLYIWGGGLLKTATFLDQWVIETFWFSILEIYKALIISKLAWKNILCGLFSLRILTKIRCYHLPFVKDFI